MLLRIIQPRSMLRIIQPRSMLYWDSTATKIKLKWIYQRRWAYRKVNILWFRHFQAGDMQIYTQICQKRKQQMLFFFTLQAHKTHIVHSLSENWINLKIREWQDLTTFAGWMSRQYAFSTYNHRKLSAKTFHFELSCSQNAYQGSTLRIFAKIRVHEIPYFLLHCLTVSMLAGGML